MDGKTLLRLLRESLSEESGSAWLDDNLSYDYLYEAAQELALRTRLITKQQTITTVADQANYALNGDFLSLYMKRDSDEDYFLKFYDGSNYSWLTWKDYEDIYYDNNTTSVAIPDHFCIKDKSSLPTQVTGTATSAGAASGGECTLTDTAADFSDVDHGDWVHNTTDGSVGIVLSKTSSTVLVTALFGGTDDDWSSSDAYVIQPMHRMEVYLDPPPSTASYYLYVPYIQRPEPVYSDYGVYRFPTQYLRHLVDYASAKYKYRDREADFAKEFLSRWEIGAVKTASRSRRMLNRGRTVKVNMRARRR